MGGPFRHNKRRNTSSSNIAGRYLAAIGAGGCGDLEDATLSPVKSAPATDARRRKGGQYSSLSTKPLLNTASAPKTPTKRESRRSPVLFGHQSHMFMLPSSSSPPQSNRHLSVQHSPSTGTAPTLTLGDLSHSWATSNASPTSRKSHNPRSTPTRSPVDYSGPQQHHNHNKKAANFYSLFPSAKMALRNSNQSKKQKDAVAAGKSSGNTQDSVSPPVPQTIKDIEHRPSSTASPGSPATRYPQHTFPTNTDVSTGIELVLDSAEELEELHLRPRVRPVPGHLEPTENTQQDNKEDDDYRYHRETKITISQNIPTKALSTASSAVMSEIASSSIAGAPTEIINNTSATTARLYSMGDVLWRKKKSNNFISIHASTAESMAPFDEQAFLTEEKKQDSSDMDSHPLPEPPQLHDTTDRKFNNNDAKAEDDLLLYGPVPFERTNTRRTSNRGKLVSTTNHAIPSAYNRTNHNQTHQNNSYANFLRRSTQYSISRDPTGRHFDTSRQKTQSPPRLRQHMEYNNGAAADTYNLKDSPSRHHDVASLLSNSTNDESSVVSSNAFLNPISDGALRQNILGNDNWDGSNDNDNTREKGGHHWWSVENVKKSPSASPSNRKPHPSSPNKPKTAYHSTLPSVSTAKVHEDKLKQESQDNVQEATPTSKQDESFETHNSEGGVIGLMDHDTDDDFARPSPSGLATGGNVPKLAPSKLDEKRSPTRQLLNSHHQLRYKLTLQGCKTTTEAEHLADVIAESKKGKLQTQVQSRRSPASSQAVAETDFVQSMVSETSFWTPIDMSEDGLNFPPNRDAPLQPLFSKDRFDGFDGDCDGQKRPSANTISSKLERKIFSGNRLASAQRQGQHDQQPKEMAREEEPLRSSPVPPEMADNPGIRRTSKSPEIWRLGAQDELNSAVSVDPIFCTQPSTSVLLNDSAMSHDVISPLMSLSKVPAKHETGTTVSTSTSLAPASEVPELTSETIASLGTSKRWPPVITTPETKPPRSPQKSDSSGKDSNETPSPSRNQVRNVPKRSISGPTFDSLASVFSQKRAPMCDEISSQQVEPGAISPTASTGSTPKRSKSEKSGIKHKASQGSFQAAFAAFEKASRGKSYEKGTEIDQSGNDLNQSFASSRLSQVLNTHLALQASEVEHVNEADVSSVDVQSIRSAFESSGIGNENAIDDDSASVKSLREVYETADADHPGSNSAVSKMRALFETKKAPASKKFEMGKPEYKEAWSKFQSKGIQTRRFAPSKIAEAGKEKESQRDLIVCSRRSNSIADRARMFESRSAKPEEHQSSNETSQEPQEKGMTNSPPTPEFPMEPAAGICIISTQPIHESPEVDPSEERIPISDRTARIVGARQSIFSGDKEEKKPLNKTKDLHERVEEHENPAQEPKIYASSSGGASARLLQVSTYKSDPSRSHTASSDSMKGPESNLKQESEVAPAKQTSPRSASLSAQIVSPPRLGIQRCPRNEPKQSKNSYLPKDFSPKSKCSKQRHSESEVSIVQSESEFSDGVTLDLSIADVSQLTNPTAIESKVGDDSTVGDDSDGEKTVELDVLDCEAKRSEASSSQQTEAAAPLIASSLKRLSDDNMSIESRNHMAKFWEKSSLLTKPGKNEAAQKVEAEKQEGKATLGNTWDLHQVEASFPIKAFSNQEPFFGMEEESTEEWQPFHDEKFWPSHTFLSDAQQFDTGETLKAIAQDPDGRQFHGDLNESIHISETRTRALDKSTANSSGNPQSKESQSHHGSQTTLCKKRKSLKSSSPLRTYDVRSHVYTQAKQHVKAMLAARSSPARKNSLHSTGVASPVYKNPAASFYQGGNRPEICRGKTPPRSQSPNTFRPITPTKCPVTPLSSSSTTPTFRPKSPNHKYMPTQRAVTPTANCVQDGVSSTHVTPKVSHRRVISISSDHATPSTRDNDSFDDTELSQRQRMRFSSSQPQQKRNDMSLPSSQFHFNSDDLPLLPDPEGFPLGSDQPSNKPTSVDGNGFVVPSTKMRSFRGVPAQTPHKDFFYGKNPDFEVYPRNHHHHFEAQEARAYHGVLPLADQGKSNCYFQGVMPMTPAAYQEEDFSSESSRRTSHPNGRLAAVVGKHAALMARLKVIKAARIRRSPGASPNEGAAVYENPQSTLGRAMVSVYKSRRSNAGSSTNHAHSDDRTHLPEVYDTARDEQRLSAYSPPSEDLFDPFNNCRPRMEETDDFSESTRSSTNFGGRLFAAALEVE